MKIEFLYFEGCPHHERALQLLSDVLGEMGKDTRAIEKIDASDPSVASSVRFPGSPTIRVNGHDVEPGFEDSGDYSLRCRLYSTPAGLSGVPERGWIASAVTVAEAGQL